MVCQTPWSRNPAAALHVFHSPSPADWCPGSRGWCWLAAAECGSGRRRWQNRRHRCEARRWSWTGRSCCPASATERRKIMGGASSKPSDYRQLLYYNTPCRTANLPVHRHLSALCRWHPALQFMSSFWAVLFNQLIKCVPVLPGYTDNAHTTVHLLWD